METFFDLSVLQINKKTDGQSDIVKLNLRYMYVFVVPPNKIDLPDFDKNGLLHGLVRLNASMDHVIVEKCL